MVGNSFNEEIENLLSVDSSGNIILPAGMGLYNVDPLLATGYGTGAGGTVTQETSKSTTVEINKPCGVITMDNAALNAGIEVAFTVTNSVVAATDVVIANIASVGTAGEYLICVGAVAAGSFEITVANVTAAANRTHAIVINFAVIKGVSS